MYRVVKRDGVNVDFDVSKISAAIEKAFIACEKQYHPSVIDMLALRVTSDFEEKIKNDVISVEDIQSKLDVTSSIKENSSFNVTNFINGSATIISFSATTDDPETSRVIADAAAQSYAIEMENILKSDSVKPLDSASKGVRSVNAVLEAWKTRVKLAILGFVLACMLVVCREMFNKKVCSIREATIKNKLPIIGIIPDYKE